MGNSNRSHGLPLSAAGVLITLGIIFGDIGTSPIYVMNAIVSSHDISRELVLGGLSCVFWTLLIITTFKYVFLALNADNRGEGGIFALYALVRRYKVTWTIFPAIIGCAALIADGFITPPISISSAVEGLRLINPNITQTQVQGIVMGILVVLFVMQQFGTNVVGVVFGPVMFIWFSMIGVLRWVY
jgi:KUP system potassium uptake protein